MIIPHKSTELWSIRASAFYGAGLGVITGIAHSYVHAFWSPSPSDGPTAHLIAQFALFVGVGAVGFAAVSAIRNWLVRGR
jgi:hypothetical protein